MTGEMTAATYSCGLCGCETVNRMEHRSRTGDLMFVTHTCDRCQKRISLEYDFQSEGETVLETDLICPWCQAVYSSYDAWAFPDDEEGVECQFCGKHFDLEIEHRRRYSTRRSLCDMPQDYEGDADG